MAFGYNRFIACMCLMWLMYWMLASRNVKTTTRRESIYSRLSYIVPTIAGGFLVFSPNFPVSLRGRFLPLTESGIWGGSGAALVLGGLLFTIWARVHLGRNWSDVVTLKEGHDLITTGPYGLVRHPIYTGILLGFAGQAIARGEWRCVIGVLIAAWAFWRKLRIEERWMLELFGEKYRSYRQRVAALIPFVV
jgi:protein-S-isoprenylcysteine O-methyltransferase Ste14